MLKVVFSQKAVDDLVTQALYIFENTQNIALSDRYLDDLKEYIVMILTKFPKAGRPAEEFGSDVRKLVYQKYSILYKVMDERIVILTLFRENLPNI